MVKKFWDISQIIPFLFAIAALTLPKYQTILDLRLKYTDLSYKNYPMTDYSSDWITYDTKAVEKALKDKVTYSECRLCNFKPNLIYNNRSTERDIILISIVGASSGFESAISARTAGFKGKILIFTDSEVPDRIKKCGAYVIQTSTTIDASMYIKQYIRFPLIASFIDKFGSYFDRLIYIDTSDVMFQSDPFNWNDDVVQLSDENSPYYNNFFVKRWGPQFVGLDHEWFKDKGNIICSGVFGGTGKALGPLVKLVSGYWRPGEEVIADQGVLDFILASNIPKNAGIKFVSNNDFATVGIRLCDKDLIKQFEIDGPPNFKDNLFSIYPAIVHQINRNSQIQNKFNELCK
ncbi:hypothetical protein TVAG_484980 [Trichomonas vaginalis G3]|uniref:Uncharacterized protein n=1 Tax=Trichomonas vaginalis (strain ATCC PRA-98 / G3) TaxID=412133 RepID=A2G943_TRIV3|nr:hypothetical protein TVAGG3_0235830 [Trichomonas vaginalis G3]EAX86327.1 hypothetical protein TVAG_484980 [Trichomonas vaginalis G3]KAI5552982.1 hypothetical protein TVAGG3_0235830 [Trichomonas vaginalis G3]|eukprot:XP_001299257.1 hypothetical protein [Trichomonas vaginalis G3]